MSEFHILHLFSQILDFHLSASARKKTKLTPLEVALHFTVMRIRGHLIGHGKFTEFGHPLGGNQMRGLIHGAVGIIDIPQATHIAVQIEPDERNIVLVKISGGGQAHGAGAYHCVHGCPDNYYYEPGSGFAELDSAFGMMSTLRSTGCRLTANSGPCHG